MTKITILSGSPRKGGNTDILVSAFIDNISKAKHEVRLINVSDKKISGCLGCDNCFKNAEHRCCIDDGMQQIYDALKTTEILVIATPIYFYGVSAQLKAVIDRFHNPIRNSFAVKKLITLCVCADSKPTVYVSIKAMYDSIRSFFHLEDGGFIVAHGVKEKGDVKSSAALAEAKSLAESL